MGSKPQYRPKLLADKLRKIRIKLGEPTYDDMIVLLDVPETGLKKNAIHYYENGKKNPPLNVLLRYSELSKISVNDLIDDRVSADSLFRS
jgi:hypothetical protein